MDNREGRLEAALSARYRLIRELGSGGMATVYLAEDVRHHRNVAVKVLRPELAAAMGPDRFLKEIRIAAGLQHPHILPVHDSGEADGFLYYVMPFVDGQTLRDRLVREGELPVAAAVKILAEVVDALVEAHAHGVIHRDIKPENVMLSGRHALVTDFGVAKAVDEATGRHQLTTVGVALGTPTYMAPEQAAADPHLDHRVDIYAVGVMAYELLTGRPPFMGGVQQVLAAHVTQAPEPVDHLRPGLAPALAELVMKCLAKRPADRWETAEELHRALEPLMTPGSGTTPTATRPITAVPVRRPRAGRLLAGGGIAVIVGVAGFVLARPRAPASIGFGGPVQMTLDEGLEMDPAVSPDGKMVAYAAGRVGAMRIFVRAVSGGAAIEVTKDLAGSHRLPRWSPDGSTLLFSSNAGGPGGAIHTVPSLGGPPRAIVRDPEGQGVAFAAWSPDGKRIVYVTGVGSNLEGTLWVRDLDGGEPSRLATAGELHSPAWSPDGRWIAFVAGNNRYQFSSRILGNLGPSMVQLVPAAGGDTTSLTDNRYLHTSPMWLPDGSGILLVSTRGGGRDIWRILVGSDGRPRGEPGRLTTGLQAGSIGLAPDGRSVAYTVFTNTANVWSIPIPAGAPISVRQALPVTRGNQHIEGLDVTPDGQWLVFDSDRGGNADIYRMRLPGGAPEQLTTDPRDDFIPRWSADGREIAFHSWRNGNRDVFLLPASGGAEAQLTADPAHDSYAALSPDSRRMAFYSNRTGTNLIYVIDRTDAGWSPPRAVSTVPGTLPEWLSDRTLCYVSGTGLQAVDADGTNQRTLVAGPLVHQGRKYAVRYARLAVDGQGILLKADDSAAAASFWSVAVTGGAPRPLVWFDDESRPSGRQEFATDGRRLYFTVDNRQSDIYLMEIRPEK